MRYNQILQKRKLCYSFAAERMFSNFRTMEKVQEILGKANQIVEVYEKQEKEMGERFNLFSILDRETDEEKTHSALIAELLNPQGSHGQGNVFLELFVELLSKKREISAFWKKANIPTSNQIDKMQIYTERNVGKYRRNECRLDILLINHEWQIVIENKFKCALLLRLFQNE